MTVPKFSEISRRQFLQHSSALGAASLLGFAEIAAAEPPPEITKIRLVKGPWLCFAPIYLAEELLRLEGFHEIEYINISASIPVTLSDSADISLFGGPSILPAIDAGMPLKVIAGLHVGCWELFGNDRVDSITGLILIRVL